MDCGMAVSCKEERSDQENFMDTNNWRPTPPSGEPTMDSGDWRTTLKPDSRQRIVNKIMETLKRHLPFSGQEGLNELMRIAVRFEEKIFTAATSQTDYLRRISLKMLTMETKSQNTMPDTGNNSNPPDPDCGKAVSCKEERADQENFMDTNNWRPTPPSGEPTVDSSDWRTTLKLDSRRRIVNKIMETLKRHLPFSGQEGLDELMKIAMCFEEKIFTVATSQTDYLRRISLKMLTMETKSQNTMPDTGNNSNPPDPDCGKPVSCKEERANQENFMDTNNWRPTPPSGEPTVDSGDWRTTLKLDSRRRIVNKIMETLKTFSGQEGLNELMKNAMCFEEKIFTVATSQCDYLRRISMKMLTMETKSQNTMLDTGNNSKPPFPGFQGLQNQVLSEPKIAEKPRVPTVNKANPNSLRSTVVTIVDEASTAVGEDLAAMRKQGLRAGMSGAIKVRCYLSALVILALVICFIFKLNHQY